MAQTNVVVDGSTEYKVVMSVLDALEKLISNRDDPETALNRKLFEWVKEKGPEKSLSTKIVNRKYEKEFREELVKRNIPFIIAHNELGNPVIMVRSCDEQKFLDLQHDIFVLRPEYHAQCTVEEICNIAQHSKKDSVIELSVNDALDYEELMTKLSQNGKGVVSAACEPHEGQHGYKVIISENDLVRLDNKFEDVAKLEIEWALAESFPTAEKLRRAQAAYDQNEIQIAMRELGHGQSIAIIDESGDSNFYTEITEEKAIFWQLDSNDQWQIARMIPDDLDKQDKMPIFDPKDPEYGTERNQRALGAFQAALRTNLQKTKNMRVISQTELSNFLGKTKQDLRNEFSTANSATTINLTEGYEQTLDEQLKAKYSCQWNDSLQNMKKRPHRPSIENIELDPEMRQRYVWNKRFKDELVNVINIKAHSQAMSLPGFKNQSKTEQLETIRQCAIEILQENVQAIEDNKPCTIYQIDDYINTIPEDYSEDLRKEIKGTIATFKDNLKNHNDAHDLQVQKRSIEEVRRHEKTYHYKPDKEAQKEYENTRERVEREQREQRRIEQMQEQDAPMRTLE